MVKYSQCDFNMVHHITCHSCKVRYVGKTEHTLHKRFLEHRWPKRNMRVCMEIKLPFFTAEFTKWCLKITFLQSVAFWPHNLHNSIENIITSSKIGASYFSTILSLSGHWALRIWAEVCKGLYNKNKTLVPSVRWGTKRLSQLLDTDKWRRLLNLCWSFRWS